MTETDGGEYFQLYALPFEGVLVFELVERRGNYGGYGASNAPFRIAAYKRYRAREKAPPVTAT
jgi:4-hydroxyphenylpyruvate dioxygenase